MAHTGKDTIHLMVCTTLALLLSAALVASAADSGIVTLEAIYKDLVGVQRTSDVCIEHHAARKREVDQISHDFDRTLINNTLAEHAARLHALKANATQNHEELTRLTVSFQKEAADLQEALVTLRAKVRRLEKGDIHEVPGWTIEFSPNSTNRGALLLPDQPDGLTCLETCVGLAASGSTQPWACGLVTYNAKTRHCLGYDATVDGMMVPSESYSLFAQSNKEFALVHGCMLNAPEDELIAENGKYVANNRKVRGRDLCLLLCRVHPSCQAVSQKTDYRFGKDAEVFDEGYCVLVKRRQPTSQLKQDYDFVTYVTL